MTDMENEWINVSPENDDMIGELLTSLEICYVTYVWAFDQMVAHWRKYKEPPTRSRVVANFTNKRHKIDPKATVQKRSLLFAIQQATHDFQSKIKVESSPSENGGTDYHLIVKTPTPEDYYEITINNRSKWKKYLEEYGSISTTFGVFYLEGEWQKTFEKQAAHFRVSLEVLPWLWHSLTIRYKNDQWQVRFNYYDPSTKVGRRKKNERTNALA